MRVNFFHRKKTKPVGGGGPGGVWKKAPLFPDFFRQPSLIRVVLRGACCSRLPRGLRAWKEMYLQQVQLLHKLQQKMSLQLCKCWNQWLPCKAITPQHFTRILVRVKFCFLIQNIRLKFCHLGQWRTSQMGGWNWRMRRGRRKRRVLNPMEKDLEKYMSFSSLVSPVQRERKLSKLMTTQPC